MFIHEKTILQIIRYKYGNILLFLYQITDIFYSFMLYSTIKCGASTKSKNAFRFPDRKIYKSPYSSFASKHGHSLIRSHESTFPLPLVSGEKSRCP